MAIFNLPFPQLDGSKVLSTFCRRVFQPIFDMLEHYGFIILLALIYFGMRRFVVRPVFAVVRYLLETPWF
ncbi:MAG: hypothetical protein IPJ30_14125 [Acidobacteria bacterium]|nr:hypothetical protein [Acidobacteriota bacterium]